MLGERTEQRGLWEADRLYIDHVGRGSFYGLLASVRGQLFEDEEFAELYCADKGRDSVPPSLLQESKKSWSTRVLSRYFPYWESSDSKGNPNEIVAS